MSNLTYISKVVERVVASRMCHHMDTNSLHSKFQSAYKKYHSTETALTRVINDCLCAIDAKQAMFLILLDCSAAFDTVDHDLLLESLSVHYGIQGNALAWLRSYLSGRTQCVCVDGDHSEKKILRCGVPQGSVLGPVLFTMYTKPLGDIANKYGVKYHLYADDTQLYLSFDQLSHNAMDASLEIIENCISEIKAWMNKHFLKLNGDKTEYMVIQSKYVKDKVPIPPLAIGDTYVKPSDHARNIGVTFDTSLNMEKHISNVTRSASMTLRDIGKIRKYLTKDSAETLVHAFISSRLDYCNSLFVGLPQSLIGKLQLVQNAAARIVTRSSKYDHITPVLYDLHWLPVYQRIQFKILLLTYKTIHDMAPEYMKDLIQIKSSSLRSEKQLMLSEPRSRLVTYGDRAFACAAPRLWNKLPVNIRLCDTLDSFKKHLKTYLFNAAF